MATTPKTRTEFWEEKFRKNVANDEKNIAALRSMGWNVIIVWECELEKNFLLTMEKITAELEAKK